jgi:hypothetical protein
MNLQNTTTTAASATLASNDEFQDLELGSDNVVALPMKTLPEPKSNTVLNPASAKPGSADEITKAADGTIIIPPSIQRDMDTTANEIRKVHGKTTNAIVAIGGNLIRMKDRLKHGEFAKWYDREFGWDAMTVSRYMKAARARSSIREIEPAAKIDLLPPTLLYDFDKLSEHQQLEVAEAAKVGRKLRAGDFKKAPTSKRAPVQALADKNQDTAADLAKRIADALPHPTREKVCGHAGFNSPAFGGLLSKAITASFGVRSNEGAA